MFQAKPGRAALPVRLKINTGDKLRAMVTDMPSGKQAAPTALTRAVAAEIRAEIARRGESLNVLDTVLSSHGYVNSRLGTKATRPLTLNDLELIATYFGMTPTDLMDRARVTEQQGRRMSTDDAAEIDRLTERRVNRERNIDGDASRL